MYSLTFQKIILPKVFTADVEEVWAWHPIEGGPSSNCIGTHVRKVHPLAHFQLRQLALRHDAVQAVTCWPPDRGHKSVWRVLCQRKPCQ